MGNEQVQEKCVKMLTILEKYFEVHEEDKAPKLFEFLQELNDGVVSVVKARSDDIETQID